MKHPTLAEAQATHDAAAAALLPLRERYQQIVDDLAQAQHAMNAATRGLREAREREAKNQIGRDRRKAKALAAQYAVQIDWDAYSNVPGDGVWWVLGPETIYGGGYDAETAAEKGVRADPCEGDHTAISWSEVLDHVEAYVEDILKLPAGERQGLPID